MGMGVGVGLMRFSWRGTSVLAYCCLIVCIIQFSIAGTVAAVGQPSGGTVVAGQAAIAAPSATSTIVTQSSQKAIINWQDFSVAAGATGQFAQPNAAAIP